MCYGETVQPLEKVMLTVQLEYCGASNSKVSVRIEAWGSSRLAPGFQIELLYGEVDDPLQMDPL